LFAAPLAFQLASRRKVLAIILRGPAVLHRVAFDGDVHRATEAPVRLFIGAAVGDRLRISVAVALAIADEHSATGWVAGIAANPALWRNAREAHIEQIAVPLSWRGGA